MPQEVSIYGRINGKDRTDRPIEADYITGSLLTTTPAENASNEGLLFQYALNTTIDNGQTAVIMFTTPNYDNEYIHAYFEFFCTYTATLSIYESGDRVGTTEVYGLCLNRANPLTDTARMMKIHTAYNSGTTDGTLILQATLGQGKIGGTSTTEPQWVLKKNTKYIVKITSGANNNIVGFSPFYWIQKHLWDADTQW